MDLVCDMRVREFQTCTNLTATISHHLLPPVSWCGKQWIHTVDPVEDSSNKEGFKYLKKGPIPVQEEGGRGDTKMVTTGWCMFGSRQEAAGMWLCVANTLSNGSNACSFLPKNSEPGSAPHGDNE